MSEGRIIIWDAFCCANCRNCVSGVVGNLFCLLQRLNDNSLLEVKATNVCGWYQRKEEEPTIKCCETCGHYKNSVCENTKTHPNKPKEWVCLDWKEEEDES